MPPSEESKPILAEKKVRVSTPVAIKDVFCANIDMDRAFFGPYPVPDWSLVVSTRELKRMGCQNWPPLGWKSADAPRDDSLEAIKQWLDSKTHPRGPLRWQEHLDYGNGRPVDWSRCVRDAWRLVKHFNALGKSKVELRERPGRYDAHEALIELENIYSRLLASFAVEATDAGSNQAKGELAETTGDACKQAETADDAPTLPEELKEREREILVALLLLGATREGKRASRRKAVRKADPHAKESTYNRPIATLGERGLVRSQKGPGGGIWLTRNGETVAKSLQKNTHQ